MRITHRDKRQTYPNLSFVINILNTILIWYALVHAQLGERMDRPYRYPEHTAPAARAVQSVGTRVSGAVGRRVGRNVERRRTGREVGHRIEREAGRRAGRAHGLADDAAERRLRVPRRW